MEANSMFLQYVTGGGMLGIMAFSIATYKQVTKVKDDIRKEVLRTKNEFEGKVNRSFERLDEVKKTAEEKFVYKDICKILHEQTARDIVDIKSDLKLLLRHNGIKD